MLTSSSAEDKASPASALKSKQERIRDNQRRSRARRQEYLGDLEKRLSECQLTCREADIQRAAFLELQIENGKLRELLSIAGVSDEFVEHYISQAVMQAGQFPQEPNPGLRQIKPKINPIDTTRNLSTKQMSVSPTCRVPVNGPNGQASAPLNVAPALGARGSFDTRNGFNNAIPNSFTPPITYATTPISAVSTPMPSTLDWVYRNQHQSISTASVDSQDSAVCEAFGFSSKGSSRVADENSMACSAAKQMIDHYYLTPEEMYEVKAQLAEGFCRPAFPGGECAIDNQKLLEVLNDLNSRYQPVQ